LAPEQAFDSFAQAIRASGTVDVELLETFGARLSAAVAPDPAAVALDDPAVAPDPAAVAPDHPDAPPPRDLIAEFRAFLDTFQWTVTADTDRDGIVNLRCEYEAGRAARIYYDQNQDGIDSWSIFCDLGAPRDGYFPALATRIVWGEYPSVGRATVRNDLEYSFGRATLAWTPLTIRFSEALYDCPGNYLFYLPTLNPDANPLPERLLLAQASWIRAKVTPAPTFRNDESMEVLFTLENGRATVADYYPWPAQSWGRAGDRVGIFARATFTNGILTHRQVDVDGDGIFEREETYVFDPPQARRVMDSLEAAALYRELFGTMPFAPGLYCARVTLDLDGDAIPDFTEEYQEAGGRVSRWTGVTYTRAPATPEGSRESEARFTYGGLPPVLVQLRDDKPVSITREGRRTPVIALNDTTYWIGTTVPTSAERALLLATLAAVPRDSITIGDYDVDVERRRVFLASIGEFKFGEFVDE
jgi:hypothetical protein